MSSLRLALLIPLIGCLQRTPLGPELGACADLPDRAYTFGEAGIGTCLAGPTDLRFIEIEGRTWLAVANSDPYYAFSTGSVLLIDWESVDPTLPMQRMSELVASAIPTDRLIGELAFVDDRPDGVPLLLTPSRLSPEEAIHLHLDDLLAFDLSDPLAPKPWSGGERIEVAQDPYALTVVDGKVFVLSLTGTDIAVLDAHATPIAPVELRSRAALRYPYFYDEDRSGSVAELAAHAIRFERRVPQDRWELEWRDHTFRAWVPTSGGLHRWNGGDRSVVVAPTGADIPRSAYPAELTGPFAYTVALEDESIPAVAFGSGGDLYAAFAFGGMTSWTPAEDVLLRGDPRGGWAAWLDAPSRFSVDTLGGPLDGIAFEARESADAPGAIGIALSSDGETFFREPAPVLTPTEGFSLRAPVVRPDPFTGGLRMWLTADHADGPTLLHATSADGRSWTTPTAVDGLPPGASHLVVSRIGGRYVGWYSVWTKGEWWLGRATSSDGLNFTAPTLLRAFDGATDPERPPRAAVLPEPILGFSVRADNLGPIVLPSIFARDGVDFNALETGGLTFRVATGHVLPTAALPSDTGANGIRPGTAVRVGGAPILYATTLGSDGRSHLAALNLASRTPTVLAGDLVPLDENELTRAADPAVHVHAGGVDLWFATDGPDGAPLIRRATSLDGLDFAVHPEPALRAPSFATAGFVPGSIQPLPNGALRLWFSGFDGSRWRIGSARSEDGGASFTVETDPAGRPLTVTAGLPGTFDDTGLTSPKWFELDGEQHLAYAALGGGRRTLGLLSAPLTDPDDPSIPWARRVDGAGRPTPWLPAISRSFAEAGALSPAPLLTDGALHVWFAGHDMANNARPRLGVAVGSPQAIFPDLRAPTAGDRLTFRTVPGGDPRSSIRLQQVVETFAVDGLGVNSLTYDEERGFLYVTSRSASYFYVIDVRDDSTPTEPDLNYLDIEAIVQLRELGTGTTMRQIVPLPGDSRLFGSARQPDSVLVIDGDLIEDLPTKRAIEDPLIGALSMAPENRLDADFFNPFMFTMQSSITTAGLAVRARDGRNHLFATHFSDNSVSTFDLDRGPYGMQVGYAGDLGESPHVVRLSPDGRFAVVASYLGDVVDDVASSTLTILDADPDSPTFGQVLSTLVNR